MKSNGAQWGARAQAPAGREEGAQLESACAPCSMRAMTRERWRGRTRARSSADTLAAARFLSLHCDLVVLAPPVTAVLPVLPAVVVAVVAAFVLALPDADAVAVAEPEGKDAAPVMASVVPTRAGTSSTAGDSLASSDSYVYFYSVRSPVIDVNRSFRCC